MSSKLKEKYITTRDSNFRAIVYGGKENKNSKDVTYV